MRHVIRAACATLLTASCSAGATSIVIVNSDGPGEGFNDNTGAAPVGGNTGTTRGAQRRNVFQAAADQWAALLDSNVPIRVDAAFDAMECGGDSAVLGAAGPTAAAEDFAGAPRANTWYPIALANAIRGIDIEPGDDDIIATFNVSIDNGSCLSGFTWWYGIDPSVPVPAGRVALLPVVFHELAHGLGFTTLTDETSGAFFMGLPDVWAFNMLDRSQNRLWRNMTNAQRAQSATNDPNLVWNGTSTTARLAEFLRPPPQLTIDAPAGIAGPRATQAAEFGPSPPPAGTTGNVVAARDGTNPFGDACTALNNPAQMAGKVALIVRGNCDFTVKVKNAQNAGAIAALIYNTESGLPGMGGSDSTVLIPAYGITQADGNTIASRADNSVTVTLGFDDGEDLAGTSGDFVRLHAPNPIQPGSSISHFTDDAYPNLLMEPSLNQSLFDRVDLTLPLFKDIGWPLESNDAPSIAAPSSLAGTEDTARIVSGVSFADADAGTATVRVTFSIATGTLGATSADGIIVSGTANALVLSGTVADINAFIADNALTYAPAANANGALTLAIAIDDLGNSGDGGPRTATRNVTINLAAVNDAPILTAPATLPVVEDGTTVLTGIVPADVDAAGGNVTLTLATETGTLTATAQANVTVGGNNTATLTLNGTVANVASMLAANRVSYTTAANASGNVTLSLTLNDNGNTGSGGARTATASTTLQITAGNDAPTLAAPASIAVDEDTQTALTGITLADPDAGTATVSLRFTVGSGTLAATPIAGDNVTVTGSGTAVLTLQGAAVAISTFIANARVRFTPLANTSGNVTLALLANDNGNSGAGGPRTTTRDITLTVTAVNDAPVLTAPASFAVTIMGTSPLRGIAIADIDAAAGTISLQASVDAGTLAAAGAGVAVTGSGTASVTLTGSLAAINTLIAGNGLTYTPGAGQTAPAALTLTANDGGSTGSGGAQTDVANAAIVLEILFADGFE